MKQITICIEDEVYLKALHLVKERKLSSTINDLLSVLLNIKDVADLEELEDLKKQHEELIQKLEEISIKIAILKKTAEEKAKQERQESLNFLEGMRRNNPMRFKFG